VLPLHHTHGIINALSEPSQQAQPPVPAASEPELSEAFLQLAARDNIQIAQPSTAAQYFHLLRRQALRIWRKPLVVFTPKSMLRHPDAASDLESLSGEQFQTVRPEIELNGVERLLFCTGKIGHEIRKERARRGDTTTGVVFLEQLYPFPETDLRAELERHLSAREIVCSSR